MKYSFAVIVIVAILTSAFAATHLQSGQNKSHDYCDITSYQKSDLRPKSDSIIITGNVHYLTKRLKIKPVSSATITINEPNYLNTITDKLGNFMLRYQALDTSSAISITITSKGFMTKIITDISLSENREIQLGSIKMEKSQQFVIY
jgi:hypothetical protein